MYYRPISINGHRVVATLPRRDEYSPCCVMWPLFWLNCPSTYWWMYSQYISPSNTALGKCMLLWIRIFGAHGSSTCSVRYGSTKHTAIHSCTSPNTLVWGYDPLSWSKHPHCWQGESCEALYTECTVSSDLEGSPGHAVRHSALSPPRDIIRVVGMLLCCGFGFASRDLWPSVSCNLKYSKIYIAMSFPSHSNIFRVEYIAIMSHTGLNS